MPISNMIEALGLEIAAIRKRGGTTQVELRGGEFIGQAEGNFLYRFPVVEDLYLRDETPVNVIVGQNEVSGIIVSFKEGILIVALEQYLGPKVPHARLKTDDSYLIQRLQERLKEVQGGEARFNRKAAERVIGLEDINAGSSELAPELLVGRPCNSEQQEAIRRSLGSDTTFVWGPPGTGKTTTLARIVEGHYRANRSVLLVSNTNIAVDTALEMVCERLEGDPGFQSGAVLRYGPVVKDELYERFGPQVILDEVVKRLTQDLEAKKQKELEKVSQLTQEASPLRAAVRELEKLESLQETLNHEKLSLASSREKLRSLSQKISEIKSRLHTRQTAMDKARNMGSFRRLVTGTSPEKLEREIRSLEIDLKGTEDAASALSVEIPKSKEKIVTLEGDIRHLKEELKHYPSLSVCRSQLQQVEKQIKKVKERIAELDRKIDEVRQEVLKRCRMLASTVYRTFLKGQIERQFDVVIIDEASMLMLPMSYYAAGLAQQSVTVAGDFRQLPPIVTSNEELATDWLKKDVFVKSEIPEMLASSEVPPYLASLSRQYRMRGKICDLVNLLSYDNQLVTDPSAEHDPSDFPLAESPLLYLDTSPYHPWTSVRLGTFSRYNLFHALLIRNLILDLADQGYLHKDPGRNTLLGAVSPYNAQTRLIQSLLEEKLKDGAAGMAATVHRFQGNEKPTMVVDLTDSVGYWLGKFMKGVSPDEDGARLINVALSRAKHHLILVANFDFLRRKAPQDGFACRLLDYFEEKGLPLDITNWLPFSESQWTAGLHRLGVRGFDVPPGDVSTFTEGSFYGAFINDLQSADASIVIFSPFLTAQGTGRWVDYLRGALMRDIAVRIVTRPGGEFGGAQRMRSWKRSVSCGTSAS